MALIRVERHRDTAVVLFSRPPANAFNLEFVEEFHARLEALSAEVPTGGLVISGDGGVFSGGVDFKAAPAYGAEQRRRMIGHINGAMTLLYGLPTATVAAVNGHAIGGAFVVVLACDARVAGAADARLGLTEVTAGIPYPACPMEVVKAEIEPAYRRRLVLTGDLITPETAHRRGLVDEIVPPEALIARAVELARAHAAAPAYARVKAQLRRDTLARMREIIAAGSDPMLDRWV
jgi:enoyl-CoA hydratase